MGLYIVFLFLIQVLLNEETWRTLDIRCSNAYLLQCNTMLYNSTIYLLHIISILIYTEQIFINYSFPFFFYFYYLHKSPNKYNFNNLIVVIYFHVKFKHICWATACGTFATPIKKMNCFLYILFAPGNHLCHVKRCHQSSVTTDEA